MPIANENQEIMDLVEPSTPLPSWMTEEDFATYGALYEKSGFETALQVPYRYWTPLNLHLRPVVFSIFYLSLQHVINELILCNRILLLLPQVNARNLSSPKLHIFLKTLVVLMEKQIFS